MDEWGEGGVQVRDANRGVLQHEVQTSVHTSTAWRRCLNCLDFVLFPSGTLGVSHPPPIPSSIGSQVFELPCSFSVMDSRNLSLSPPPLFPHLFCRRCLNCLALFPSQTVDVSLPQSFPVQRFFTCRDTAPLWAWSLQRRKGGSDVLCSEGLACWRGKRTAVGSATLIPQVLTFLTLSYHSYRL